MSKQTELFGKTFDQQIKATGGKPSAKDILPNVLVRGELVLEPVSNGIRVTARDENHRMLWGFIASQGMLTQAHCPVAIYDKLQELVSTELKKHGLPSQDEQDPVLSAKVALDDLERTVRELRESITVKKESEATRERAINIRRLARDANRTIKLEADSL
ncbi:MAG: hypothetical protein FJ395_09765 [Verrucomicrobia bacterium]|nr:hypothetical protein [Verrucomicrobiota bacterium]